jgi:hypothetical protein
MMHCYKGAGLAAERQSMEDAVRFAGLCRDEGLRFGVYNYSGAFLWEPFFREMPGARDWVVLDPTGRPCTYDNAGYRYYWNRNHPAAEAFYRGLVRFAVEDIKADLIHFDNYIVGPGFDANSVDRFRDFLRKAFTAEALRKMGVSDVKWAQAPRSDASPMLRRAWEEFTACSLAESYQRMGQFARGLRPDILVECNPNGVPDRIVAPVDHGRLLENGEAYWVESGRVGMVQGRLVTRIRNYKVGRALGNMTFDYTLTPLEMAESMAFNVDCLGCVTWFEYGELVAMPGSRDAVSPDLAPFIRFFHRHRDLLRNADVVADLGVVRSFPSQVFGGMEYAGLNARLENMLIENRSCFQIIYDTQLHRIPAGRFPMLAFAGCVALSDEDLDAIRHHVAAGGKLCVIGPFGTHDFWMHPRPSPGLGDLPKEATLELPPTGNWLDQIRQWGQGASLTVDFKPTSGLCSELTDQADRRLVHLVNYLDQPVLDVDVKVRLPSGRQVSEVRLVSPEHDDQPALPFSETDGSVMFRIPRVGIYEIAVVELIKRANLSSPDE